VQLTTDCAKAFALVRETMRHFGGVAAFAQAWAEAMQGAHDEGDAEVFLRHATATLKLWAAVEQRQAEEAREMAAEIEQLSDAEIQRRRRAAVLRAAKEDPEAIAEVLRQAGWNITAIHSRDHGS
jgi:hypothetical protein